MDNMKAVVTKCPALCTIDYESELKVVLVVDLSCIRVGWYLGQEYVDEQRQFNCFGLIN